MNKLINESLLKMNTEGFLSNIKKVFNEFFSNGNIERINLDFYYRFYLKNLVAVKKVSLKYRKF